MQVGWASAVVLVHAPELLRVMDRAGEEEGTQVSSPSQYRHMALLSVLL